MFIVGFILKHIPMIIAIILFSFFLQYTFLKLLLLMWFFSAMYEAILWQFSACILVRVPIPSQRTTIQIKILNNTVSLKERIIYFVFKLMYCLFDLQYIFGILLACGLFHIGLKIFFGK